MFWIIKPMDVPPGEDVCIIDDCIVQGGIEEGGCGGIHVCTGTHTCGTHDCDKHSCRHSYGCPSATCDIQGGSCTVTSAAGAS